MSGLDGQISVTILTQNSTLKRGEHFYWTGRNVVTIVYQLSAAPTLPGEIFFAGLKTCVELLSFRQLTKPPQFAVSIFIPVSNI